MLEKLQSEKIQKISWYALLVFLCCYFMMLFDFPNVVTIFFGSMICLILMIKQKKFRLDLGTCLLTITIASYFLIVFGTRGFTMSLPYVGILMYVLGNYVSNEIKENDNKEILFLTLLFMIVLGHSIHGYLNSYLFLDKQWDNGDIRVWMDCWMGVYLPGTAQIVYFLPVLAMVLPAIIYFSKRKIVNVMLIFTAFYFTYIAMYSQTRTSVLILPLVFVAQIFLYIILEWEKIKKNLSKKKVKYLLGILCLLLIAAFLLLRNHPIVTEFMSIMGRDGGILNNIRFKVQRAALQQLFVYPMGGDQMDFLGYPHAHNAWLDMANMGGLIPFFAFSAYTFLTIYELIRWLMKKEISTERKLVLAGIYAAFFLYYTVERAFEGSMHFMTPWFFINGMVHGEICKNR